MSVPSEASQRSASLGALSTARHVSCSGRFLRILFFYFSVCILGFLNGFFWVFLSFGFPLVFLSFWIKKRIFSFTRVTVLLSRESRPCHSETEKREAWFCFHERHVHASRKRKKTRFLFFFPSVRGTVLLPREARLCFRERHGRASWK